MKVPVYKPLIEQSDLDAVTSVLEEAWLGSGKHVKTFENKINVNDILIKKRPYNLFHRANLSMRTKDVKRSFGNAKTWEVPILEHAVKCIAELKKLPAFPKINSTVTGIDTTDLSSFSCQPDVVYMDPPYINGKGGSVDYSDFYNFLEGLVDYSLFDMRDESYPHKPIAKKNSSWLNESNSLVEINNICKKWHSSIIIMSYRSDGRPTPEAIKEAFCINGRSAEIHSAGEYQYALSKNKDNEEIFIISYP